MNVCECLLESINYCNITVYCKVVVILTNPSVDYDADSIIEQSVRLVRERHGILASLIKQYLVYPFTKAIGLRFIQKQLSSGKWQAYTREEFSQEMERAGFAVQHIEEVYAGSAFSGYFVLHK